MERYAVLLTILKTKNLGLTPQRMVAAAEARSEHSVGNCIVQASRARRISIPASSEFRAIPGQGVEASVEGSPVWVGSQRLFTERGMNIPESIDTHGSRWP